MHIHLTRYVVHTYIYIYIHISSTLQHLLISSSSCTACTVGVELACYCCSAACISRALTSTFIITTKRLLEHYEHTHAALLNTLIARVHSKQWTC
jgi:hypothetical protein